MPSGPPIRKKFEGVELTDTTIFDKGESGSLVRTKATVETASDIDRRITAARLILTGPFALGLRARRTSASST